MLRVDAISVNFGAVRALEKVSLTVAKGEIVCLIGANGAGKSTTLNAISGLARCHTGDIALNGKPLIKARPSEIVRMGIVQVPEGRQVFPDLTVLENLEMGAYTRPQSEFAEARQRVFELFPRLDERKNQLAGLMSGGEQQMLAIGRALMARPALLLLDEPSMGLAPLVVAEIFKTLQRLRSELGLTVVLVEQNAKAALELADRGYVLTTGTVSASGSATELLSDRATREAFLGQAKFGRSPNEPRVNREVIQ